jgi:acyl-CoA thioesterase FadM
MYPFIRLAKDILLARRAPALDLLGTHVSHHICWPWDLDPWMELNNGRTLTLFDLGRLPHSLRTGFAGMLRAQGWGMTVAGSSVRYRRRVRAFHRVEMHTRLAGWDGRFFYMDQSMWREGEALNNLMCRLAVTDAQGIVAPARVVQALGRADPASPALPDWIAAWIAADARRPWPPQMI